MQQHKLKVFLINAFETLTTKANTLVVSPNLRNHKHVQFIHILIFVFLLLELDWIVDITKFKTNAD